MNSPFISGNKTVLRSWKDLRTQLTADKTDLHHLNLVTRFWSNAPISTKFMDWDQPSAWPDAWEMIHLGDYDESMMALAMFYTLIFSDDHRWSPDRLRLMLVRDHDRHVQRLVLDVDHRWVMNLEYNSIIDKKSIGQSCMIQQVYEYDGKRHSLINENSTDNSSKKQMTTRVIAD